MTEKIEVIPIVVFIHLVFHGDRFIIPSIALIVGLHFYPMAKLFNRKIDNYLTTWTCLISIIRIIMTTENNIQQSTVFSFVGIGTAIATTTYRIYNVWYLYGKSRTSYVKQIEVAKHLLDDCKR